MLKSTHSLAIEQINDNRWQVQSHTAANTHYIVQLDRQTCDCQLKCTTCKICVHTSTCTCLDSIIRSTIRKHSHFVAMKERLHCPQSEPRQKCTVETIQYFTDLLAPGTRQQDILAARKKLETHVSDFSLLIKDCIDIGSLNTATKHITSAISVVKAAHTVNSTRLPRKRKYAPNSNHQTQKYFSTKKRRVQQNLPLAKPSGKEKDQCLQQLHNQMPDVCGVCLKEDDLDGMDGGVEWIQCSSCSMWMHLSCSKLDRSLDIPDHFECQFCEE